METVIGSPTAEGRTTTQMEGIQKVSDVPVAWGNDDWMRHAVSEEHLVVALGLTNSTRSGPMVIETYEVLS